MRPLFTTSRRFSSMSTPTALTPASPNDSPSGRPTRPVPTMHTSYVVADGAARQLPNLITRLADCHETFTSMAVVHSTAALPPQPVIRERP